MKRILVLAALCGLAISAAAQTTGMTPRRMAEVRGGQMFYGFVKADGTVVVEPSYSYAREFSEGLAAVLDASGRWGFIDTTGKRLFSLPATVAHENRFNVGDFSEGLCWFRDSVTDKVGFIDTKGRVVIEPQWGFAKNFSDGLAAVGKGRVMNQAFFEVGSLEGYIDHSGKMVIPLEVWYHNHGTEGFSDGRAYIELGDSVLIIDTKGNELYGGRYRRARRASEGLQTVAVATNAPCNALHGDNNLPKCKLRWCVIDTTGTVVIDRKEASLFSGGMACVKVADDSYIFIDRTGKQLFGRGFKYAESFSEGLAYVAEKNGKKGYIDRTGKMVLRIPVGFEPYYESGFKCGLVWVFKKEEQGKYTNHIERLIDRTGKVVWEYEYYSWFD